MRRNNLILSLIIVAMLLSGCEANIRPSTPDNFTQSYTEENKPDLTISSESSDDLLSESAEKNGWFESIPEYRGTPYIEVNNDIPFFTDEEKKNTDAFENYSDLDELGRCGVAYANICLEIMPTEEREESLSSVTPSGWEQNQYNGEWLLNRCHLIGYQLAGENANEKNLISGTRYFNVTGMLPFENTVADYMDDNITNHVLYRVTPVYKEDYDLMAYGVLMEAWSVEDNGYGCQFCVFVYNVQPGIAIDYATGENWLLDNESSGNAAAEEMAYILNTSSMKFHSEDCSSASRISDKNKSVVTTSREELISQGYDPAQCCNP